MRSTTATTKLWSRLKPCLNMAAGDLRRFWSLPAATFLMLILFVAMPDLQAAQAMERTNLLQNSPLDLIAAGALPIMASVCVCAWLHDRRLAARAHALPLTRNQHFFGHLASGWILSVLPFAALFFVYMYLIDHSAMRLQLQSESDYYYNAYFWTWLWDMLITTTYVYSLSVLAGIIAGTVVTHLLLAMFFNGLLPVIVYLVNHIVSAFWTGFWGLPLASSHLSPLTREWSSAGLRRLDTFQPNLIYTISAIFFLLAAWLLYRRWKVERVGESAMFKGFGEFVCVLFGFIGLCSGGMTLHSFSGSGGKALFLTGAAAGGILFYVVGRMILEKRLQVFHLAAMKKLAAFILCGAVFAVFMAFDLGGCAKRLPQVSETAAVQVDSLFGLECNAVISDPALIEKTRALGLALAEYGSPSSSAGVPSAASGDDEELFFVYFLDEYDPDYQKDSRKVRRSYAFDPAQPEIASAYKALFEDPAYKRLSPLYDLAGGGLTRILVPGSMGDSSPDIFYIIDPDHILAVARAVQEDFRSMTYEDILDARKENPSPIWKLELQVSADDGGGYVNTTLELRQNYSRTLKALKELGYDKYIPNI